MVVTNLTSSNLSVLLSGDRTLVIPANGKSKNILATADTVRKLCTAYNHRKIRFSLLGPELAIQDEVPEFDLSLWTAPIEK